MPVLALSLALPVVVQAVAMAFDEAHYHRRRGLGLWERVGHPIDTLSVAACLGLTLATSPTPSHLAVYAVLALGSCMLVTKDEAVHARRCSAGEHWLHALLFVLHPICLAAFALAWVARGANAPTWLEGARPLAAFLPWQLGLTVGFALYQALYWNVPWPSRSRTV